jgi:uncharacterized protein DUF7009
MKLRIKGPSLRLRLTQSEVRALDEQRVVEERVPFAPGIELTYRLRSDARVAEITASYRDDVLEVRVPESAAREWCRTGQVTLAHEQPVPQGALRIVLEKDFECLAPREDEDESDNFPHPDKGHGKTC